MEVDEVLNPSQVGVLGLNAVMLTKNDLAYLLKERARLWCGNIIAHKSPVTGCMNSSCCARGKQVR